MLQKLLITIMGLFLVIAAGSCNIYPLYLGSLKDHFKYSLKELNLYGAFINIGNWVAITTGILYDKVGPRICCIISAIVLPSTYITLSILLYSSLESLNIIFLLLLGFIIGQASSLIATTGLNTNLKNYNSKHSTAIVGIITTNVAISPSIFTTFKEATPNMGNSSFFLFVAGYLVIIIGLCAWIFKVLPNPYSTNEKMEEYENYKEKKIIRLITALSLFTLCVYLFGVIINKLNNRMVFPNVIIIPLLQFLNFGFLLGEKYELWDQIFFNKFIIEDIKEKEKMAEMIEKNKVKDKDKEVCDNTKDKEKEMRKPIEESVEEINTSKVKEISERLDSPTDIGRHLETDSPIKADSPKIKEQKLDDIAIEVKNGNQSDSTSTTNEKIHDKISLSLSEIQPQLNISHKNIEVANESNQNQIIHEIIDNHLQFTILEPKIAANQSICQMTFRQKITNPELISLFLVLLLSIGSAISNLNNIQFIITSIMISPTTQEIFQYAILYFAFNSFSRIFSGIILSKLILYEKLYYFLVIVSSIGLFSQILGILLIKEVMYLSISLAGMTHGGFIAFIPVYTRVYYHINDLNIIIGLLTTGCAIGSITIGTCIFSAFYEKSKDKEFNACYGSKCFRPAYLLTSLFLSTCLFISICLVKINNSKKIKAKDQRNMSLKLI